MSASNNTITFQGEVTAQTCSVTVNGLEANPVVLLPTVSSSDLDASGQTKGKTTFTLGVSGCTSGSDDLDIKLFSSVAWLLLLVIYKIQVPQGTLNFNIEGCHDNNGYRPE